MNSGKQALRQQLRSQRASLPASSRTRAARKAARHAKKLLRGCRNVAVYLSCGSELDTAPLIHQLNHRGSRVYVPKLRGQRMAFVSLKRGAALRRNRFGIFEPVTSQRAARLDAIVLPLLGFDATGRRLGQGGGYYDRVLANSRPYRRPLRIGYAYAVQEVAKILANAQDARLDTIITEQGIHRFCRSEPCSRYKKSRAGHAPTGE